ncbi:MAG: hypothetical protein ACP5UI_04110 [Thermoprotei archaeon]|nr:hypothetical protein [TACK group archaeon]
MLEEELLAYLQDEWKTPLARVRRRMISDGHSAKDVDEAIRALVERGTIGICKEGRAERIFPLLGLMAEIKAIQQAQKRLESILSLSDPSFESSFMSAYEKVKDVAGIATLRDVRLSMGMPPEEFYKKFQEIVNKFRLSPGGEEGLTIDGNLWGVIMGVA